MKLILVAVAALLVGLAAGLLLRPASPAAVVEASAPLAAAPSAGSTREPCVEASAASHAQAASVAAVAAAPGASDVAALALENAKLRETVLRLRVDAADKLIAETERGVPLERPASLDPRFEADALRDAVTKALAEAGLEGSVTSVDCTEYPCIIYGDSKSGSGPEEFRKLRETSAFSAYAEDSQQGMGWIFGKGPTGGPKRHLFGLAVLPKDDAKAREAELRKRLRFRSQQMASTYD